MLDGHGPQGLLCVCVSCLFGPRPLVPRCPHCFAADMLGDVAVPLRKLPVRMALMLQRGRERGEWRDGGRGLRKSNLLYGCGSKRELLWSGLYHEVQT